ncbi:MAG TPA: hypothetical protein VEP90_18835 [Methylomirabilota bacterium]|nr:hypothetical protein [Methylomirabilota bacterium]
MNIELTTAQLHIIMYAIALAKSSNDEHVRKVANEADNELMKALGLKDET